MVNRIRQPRVLRKLSFSKFDSSKSAERSRFGFPTIGSKFFFWGGGRGAHKFCDKILNFGECLKTIIVHFNFFQVKTDSFNVCIIDDCQDSDVPLLELSLVHLFFKKDIPTLSGEASCLFSVDYYNRLLSGWEPFVEPWR